MKTILVLAAMFAATVAQAQTFTCKTAGGKTANFTINSRGISYGNGWVKPNGQSSTSLYFRNGFGTTVIVNKSVLQNRPGKIVWMVDRDDERDTRKVFYCNQ